jgi:hypothetical protein
VAEGVALCFRQSPFGIGQHGILNEKHGENKVEEGCGWSVWHGASLAQDLGCQFAGGFFTDF